MNGTVVRSYRGILDHVVKVTGRGPDSIMAGGDLCSSVVVVVVLAVKRCDSMGVKLA